MKNNFFILLKKLYLFPLRIYRKFISPVTPPCCRFVPTCSEYAMIAIERFGIFKGTLLAAGRLIRCNPLCKGGIDNVPDQFILFKNKRRNGGENI
ncbi:MAG: membrane protein insertion efficiency factor YidD [Oscillospiraceae bacterium]|nr:membrane protein insertion efficiency factor YidD [Oscillospiraceae bacterium]